MIITRTPYRISFFGGGTDHPSWYRTHGGRVLSTTIDKYCYVSCRRLPPFFQHKYRIVYSSIELVKYLSQIHHPVVRETLKYLDIRKGLEIHYDGDIPAKSGMGTSSSFTVGLLHALYGIKGHMISKEELARQAITIEQDLIGETVGSQDQVAAAYGGFNRIEFKKNGTISVTPILLSGKKIKELQNRLLLYFTGFTRHADTIEKSKMRTYSKRKTELHHIGSLVDTALHCLQHGAVDDIGALLNEAWKLKKSLSDQVSTSRIDGIYEDGIRAGASGGKILGAGGGGFMLFFTDPEHKPAIRKKLSNLLEVPFSFEKTGSQIIVYQPDSYE